MFGGFGIYHNVLMFGLVADGDLYLKADEETAKHFEALGRHQFEYMKNEKTMKMSYYLAPEESFDDPETANTWAQRAHGAALHAKRQKTRSRA